VNVERDWLASRAALEPDRPALIAGGTCWSFAELDQRASAVALRLGALGVAPTDRVALLLGNSPAAVELVHAVPRLGATLVPLNTRLAAAEQVFQLGDVGARLLVYDERQAERAQAVTDLRTVSVAELGALQPGQAHLRTTVNRSALHSIIYTSGTTGQPKGALLSTGNFWASARASAANLGVLADDRWLAVLPLFHVGGLSIPLRGVVSGMTTVLHEAFDPAAVNHAIDHDRVTIVSVVATMLQRMLDEREDRPYPEQLRCVLVGGGPVPKPLLERCLANAVPVVQTYGLTETASQVATLRPADALRRLGSAGQALPGAEIRIVGSGGEALPAGEAGEIAVRGPMVTAGYWRRPAETARALIDGWLRTGDLGYLDAEGYLFVLDRRDDLIVSGGENVYPAEVEAVLLAQQAVREAAVVGMPDARWGQVPVAAVVLRDGLTLDETQLRTACAAVLARYKVPARVVFVPALPRTAAGKLRRAEVRRALHSKYVLERSR
jgi:O-succinylbenzoic acid--CoA ligase